MRKKTMNFIEKEIRIKTYFPFTIVYDLIDSFKHRFQFAFFKLYCALCANSIIFSIWLVGLLGFMAYQPL